MAYRPISINPLDLQKSTGIGVSIPFSSDSVFETVYTTAEQMKYNIINYLLTDKKERLFNPGFGAGLRSQLFQPMVPTELEALEIQIRIDLENYFPKISLQELSVIPSYDQNYITLKMSYSIINTGNSDNITLTFNNGN